MNSSLPTPRHLVTALISSRPSPDDETANTSTIPLKDAPGAKELLLTLHALFPNELLPALDLLDRGLVVRHRHSAYYVQSAQQQSSKGSSRFRSATSDSTTHYEVRLDAWSCSCPAFTFSAFKADPQTTLNTLGTNIDTSNFGWLFGGLTRGTDMPICKHLLACVLVEHCSLFSHLVEEREISVEEAAGWAAGWGD